MNGLFLRALLFLFLSSFAGQAGPLAKVPFIITKPGRYYPTKNLTPAGNATSPAQAAITVLASNVELDLGGFSVIGNAANADLTKASRSEKARRRPMRCASAMDGSAASTRG